MQLPKTAKFMITVCIFAVAIVGFLYLNTPESHQREQTTNDAYITADFTYVAPQISGNITDVLVRDNQYVKKGEILATIDNKDYVVTQKAAKARLDSHYARLDSLKAKLAYQASVIAQASSELEAERAELTLAQLNSHRYANLAKDGSGTQQALQEAQAQLRVKLAQVDKKQAQLAAENQQALILQADIEQAKAGITQSQAELDKADLQLSYTEIRAPISGTIGQKSVRVGGYVKPGESLLAIVPLDEIYVEANFRETQLANVQVGQSVTVTIDAFPDRALSGHVDSLSPASGASYAAVGAHNATGNFTKIVQRLPVKITLDPGQSLTHKLRVGMSVVPTIVTR